MLHHILTNLTQGMQQAGMGAPAGEGNAFNIELPMGGQVLFGNPGDYAWGPGGLDAVISQVSFICVQTFQLHTLQFVCIVLVD